MRRLFVDTFYLVALAHRRDTWHAAVMAFSRSVGPTRLYTVDEVLVEFLTACSGSAAPVRTRAARTVRNALDDNQWTVSPQSRQSLLDALDFYESRRDKEYSLTDCVSMLAMRRGSHRSPYQSSDVGVRSVIHPAYHRIVTDA